MAHCDRAQGGGQSGSGDRVQGLGFRVVSFGFSFEVLDLGLEDRGEAVTGFRVWGSGWRV